MSDDAAPPLPITRGEWTEGTLAELRRLWTAGMTAARIGVRLGFTKSAVVGKAHRQLLTARASPIKRAETGAVQARNADVLELHRRGQSATEIAKALGISRNNVGYSLTILRAQGKIPPPPPATLPPLRSLRVVPDAPAPVRPKRAAAHVAAPVPPAVVESTPARTPAEPRQSLRPKTSCCWPIGEPRSKGFRYCDAPVEGRGPYFEEHRDQAYTYRPSARWLEGSARVE